MEDKTPKKEDVSSISLEEQLEMAERKIRQPWWNPLDSIEGDELLFIES